MQLKETTRKLTESKRLYAEWCVNDKMNGGDRLSRAIKRHAKMLEFLKLGVKCKDSGGQITIANKFHYILATGKWRIQGKATWYCSSSPKQFLDKIQSMTPMIIMPFKCKVRPKVVSNNHTF